MRNSENFTHQLRKINYSLHNDIYEKHIFVG